MSELPNGWVSTPLKALLSSEGIFSDGDWIESKDQDPNGSIRLLQLADIGDGYFVDKSLRFVNEETFVALNCTELKTGDVLIARMPDPLGRACLLPEMPQPCITVVDVAVFRTGKEGVSNKWLMNAINSPQLRAFMETNSSGTTRKRIARGKLSDMELPVPPLNEQKRIADKLDAVLARVDACRDHLDRIPVILKLYRQSVLAAAFTGRLTEDWRSHASVSSLLESLKTIETPPRPNRFSSRTERILDGDFGLALGNPGRALPDGWHWIPLVDIARMESGHTPSRAHPEYWGGSVPWIGIADARDGHGKTIQDTYQHTNSLGLANSAARLLPADTVCLSRTASVGYVVKMGISMATSQDFANWSCTAVLNPDWLMYLFVAEKDAIYRFGKGSTHTTVYYPELMAFHVALPSIEEQSEIVRRVESLFAYADRLEAHYAAARAQVEKLTPATLAKAFRGELVPQDPSDEPASKLLEHIRAISTLESSKPRGRKLKAKESVS